MITLEPYMHDMLMYQDFPDADKWVFNKLRVAEVLGYRCGPSGTSTNVGTYIIKPIMNLAGMGTGGVFQHDTPLIRGVPVNNHIPAKNFPGHFWCEAFGGAHIFTEYVNDVPVRGTESISTGSRRTFNELTVFPELPTALKGVSRYSLAEFIGGNLIEYSPRHISVCAHQDSIDDYLTIDPSYNPSHIKFGIVDMRKIPFGEGGWTWEDIESSRRPWT